MAFTPLPRRSYRKNQLSRYPQTGILQFPLGLDTLHPVQQVPLGALKIARNVELNERGATRRRRGRTAYGGTPGTAVASTGEYELILRSGTDYLLMVTNGRLYSSSDDAATWTQIPIRLYRPYPAYADDGTNGENLAGVALAPAQNAAGAPGANIVAATSYDYAILAVYGGGKTTLSAVATWVAANPAQEIKINFHGCYKATTYEIWRRATTGPGTWGRLATGVTHTTTGGKTLVIWTDDGNTAPDTTVVPSASNTTEYVLSTTAKVDWETDAWSSDNGAYFVNGEGIMVTDGTSAQFVQPTNPNSYLEDTTGINALGDVTWGGHTSAGLIRHHAYIFLADGDEPKFYWSRSLDPAHFPQLAVTDVAHARGGTCLDFAVKDDHLVVGMTTGIWALVGTVFPTTGPPTDGTVYFKEISDIGVQTARSMAKAANGWVIYLARNETIRAVITVSGTTDQVQTVELVPSIRPTIADMADHDDACAFFADSQYWLNFPSDAKAIRIYFFESEDSQRTGLKTEQAARLVPVQDTVRPFRNFLLRRDGTLLAADDTTDKLWKLQNGYADNTSEVSSTWETPPLDLGDPMLVKHVFPMTVIVEQPSDEVTLSFTVSSDLMTSPVTDTLSSLGQGYDLSTYDVSVYDPWTLVKSQININGEGHWFTVSFTDTGDSTPVTVYGIAFHANYVEDLD